MRAVRSACVQYCWVLGLDSDGGNEFWLFTSRYKAVRKAVEIGELREDCVQSVLRRLSRKGAYCITDKDNVVISIVRRVIQ